MEKPIIFVVLLFSLVILRAQENQSQIVEGTVLTLGTPSGSRYQHIDFPRKNTIIKRGGIANFNSLIGKKVVVKQSITKTNGTLEATLKRKDGLNFFRFFPTVKANLNKAIAEGELLLSKTSKSDS